MPEVDSRPDAAAEGEEGATLERQSCDAEGPCAQQGIERVEVDASLRPATEGERAERQRAREERKQREEAAWRRPLRGMAPGQVQERARLLEDDRREMSLLMQRCDRPAVKARLSEFLVEMDNELARLREDPLELDDEDRQALRQLHLHKMSLLGAARTGQQCAPRALATVPAGGGAEEPWLELGSFALDLGEARTPFVGVDVRLEAVERLPPGAVTCEFGRESFDLRVAHSLEGRRYRLRRACLQHDIDPVKSSFRVKRNHVLVRLAKMPSAEDGIPFGSVSSYASWTDLCSHDGRSRNAALADLMEDT